MSKMNPKNNESNLKGLISVLAGRASVAQLRDNRTLVRKTLSHDVTLLVFLPFRESPEKNGLSIKSCNLSIIH